MTGISTLKIQDLKTEMNQMIYMIKHTIIGICEFVIEQNRCKT